MTWSDSFEILIKAKLVETFAILFTGLNEVNGQIQQLAIFMLYVELQYDIFILFKSIFFFSVHIAILSSSAFFFFRVSQLDIQFRSNILSMILQFLKSSCEFLRTIAVINIETRIACVVQLSQLTQNQGQHRENHVVEGTRKNEPRNFGRTDALLSLGQKSTRHKLRVAAVYQKKKRRY